MSCKQMLKRILFLDNMYYNQLHKKEEIELYRNDVFTLRKFSKFGYSLKDLQNQCDKYKIKYTNNDDKQKLCILISNQLENMYNVKYEKNEFEQYIQNKPGSIYWRIWIEGKIEFEKCTMGSTIAKFKKMKSLEHTKEYKETYKKIKTSLERQNDQVTVRDVKNVMLRSICNIQRDIDFKRHSKFYKKYLNSEK